MKTLPKQWIADVDHRHILEMDMEAAGKTFLEYIIFEGVTNALDSGANKIWISKQDNRISFQDNGKGMNQNEFKDCFNLAYTTKNQGKDLGFKGVGAKTIITRCKGGEIETRSNEFNGRASFKLNKKDKLVVNRLDRDSEFLTSEREGTKLSYILKAEDSHKLTKHRIRDILFRYFPTLFDPSFLNYYQMEEIYPEGMRFSINGAIMEKQSVIPNEKDATVVEQPLYYNYGKHEKKVGYAKIARLNTKLSADDWGIYTSVFGAIIRRSTYLGQTMPKDKNHLVGFVEFPSLAEAMKSTKEGFHKDNYTYVTVFPNAFTNKVYLPFLKTHGFTAQSSSDEKLTKAWRQLRKLEAIDALEMPPGFLQYGTGQKKSKESKERVEKEEDTREEETTETPTTRTKGGRSPKIVYAEYPDGSWSGKFVNTGDGYQLRVNQSFKGREIMDAETADNFSMAIALLDYNIQNLDGDLIPKFNEFWSELAIKGK